MTNVPRIRVGVLAALAATAPAPDAPGKEKPESKDKQRVTIFSEKFEQDFPGGWERKGNLPDNSALYGGTPKRGAHSLRQAGSLVTDKGDLDCYVQRIVSTAGYHDIQVSLFMGAKGMDTPVERMVFVWADQGTGSPHGHWYELKAIKGGDADNDGKLHQYSFSLPATANDNPRFVLWFAITATDAADEAGYVDDIVVTGHRLGTGAGRVTIYSEDFEGDFPGQWDRRGNLPSNTSLFSDNPKRGAHSLQLLGSPVSGGDDFDTYMQREISTAGKKNIQVSFYLGAGGLKGPGQMVSAMWFERGVWSPNQYLHTLKSFKGGDPEGDGKLRRYSFSLPPEASNNPKFTLWFGVTGLSAASEAQFLDDILVTGEPQ